jgi:hypothetical protein
MATSGTYSFSVTRDDIIREAMLNIGKLDVYGSIDPVETADCARKLNMMVKTWMGTMDFAPGLKMWTRQRGDLFLSQTQYRYALGPTGDNFAGGVTAIAGANFGTDQLSVSAAAAATNIYTGVGSTSNFTAGDYAVIQLDSGDIFSTTISSVTAASGYVTIATGLPSAASSGNCKVDMPEICCRLTLKALQARAWSAGTIWLSLSYAIMRLSLQRIVAIVSVNFDSRYHWY